MLAIKLIKKLQAIVANLKAKAASKQVGKLIYCAERTDDTADLCDKRIEFARQMQEHLVERAYTKYDSDTNRIEAERKEAARLLKEIISL